MINTITNEIKLIDFGLATYFHGSFDEMNELNLFDIYQNYYNNIKNERNKLG